MKRFVSLAIILLSLGLFRIASGEIKQRVVDIPTRPDVTQRFLYLLPENPKAAVILFAGGNGGLQLLDDGSLRWGSGNFLVRSRRLFAERGLSVVVVDAPSDRQGPPYLDGFRQTPKHVADVKGVIAWLRRQNDIPVWLIGTSRGTQSAAFIATQLDINNGGPDGLVLTSTILRDTKERSVPEMSLETVKVPVLVVHHKQDGCKLCSYWDTSYLMKELSGVPKKELLTITGGENQGDPCEAFAHHGYNGQEKEVVGQIADWIQAK